MTKLESLHKIITNFSSYDDIDGIDGICNALQWNNNCAGVKCCECPFKSQDNLNKCIEEIENHENC